MGDSFRQPMYPGGYFHIYNRGNNREKLYYDNYDYDYFLKKYWEYMADWTVTFAYCLLPNHFHFLVKIKESDGAAEKASEQFRRFFISYAQTINLKYHRSGSLFRKNFNRLPVESDSNFLNVAAYIHLNPVHHRITSDFTKYQWSSYPRIIANTAGMLDRQHLLDRFGSLNEFIEFHRNRRSKVAATAGIED
ncbi:MAG: transposase [Bacteroidota bacterium]